MSQVASDITLLRAVSTQAVVSAATGAVAFVAAIVIVAFLDVVLLGVTLGVVAGTSCTRSRRPPSSWPPREGWVNPR